MGDPSGSLMDVVWRARWEVVELALRLLRKRAHSLLVVDLGDDLAELTEARFVAWIVDRRDERALVAAVRWAEGVCVLYREAPSAPQRGQLWWVVCVDHSAEMLVVEKVGHDGSRVVWRAPNSFGLLSFWEDMVQRTHEDAPLYTYMGDAPHELRDGYEPPGVQEAYALMTRP